MDWQDQTHHEQRYSEMLRTPSFRNVVNDLSLPKTVPALLVATMRK